MWIFWDFYGIGYVCLDVKFGFFFSLLADKPTTTPRRGFIGKGKDITTKHDEVVCGRKNTARMENVSENLGKLNLCKTGMLQFSQRTNACPPGLLGRVQTFLFSLLNESKAVFALLVILIGSLSFVSFLFKSSLLLSNSRICTELFWENKTISKSGTQLIKHKSYFLKE